jgi:hypothetical protein
MLSCWVRAFCEDVSHGFDFAAVSAVDCVASAVVGSFLGSISVW